MNKRYVGCWIVLIGTVNQWLIPTVVIHNETLIPIYTGVYYYDDSGVSELQTAQVTVAPGADVVLQEPSISILKNRYIFADTKPLSSVLSYEDFKTIARARLRLPGHYYFATHEGRLKGYTLTQWHLIRPLTTQVSTVGSLISEPIYKKIRTESIAVKNNPYKNSPVTVTQSSGVSAQENIYRVKRKQYVKTALEKFLGRSLEGKYIPEISCVLSGGGYRAMLYGAGSLAGAQKSGLFDTCMSISALSGSTWALAYITFEHLYHKKSIEQSMYDLIKKSTKNLAALSPREFSLLHDVLLWNSGFDLPLTTIDMYGLLLGNVLFEDYADMRHQLYLSNQQQALADGTYPLPIYTAVPAETTEFEKLMYEFTPYEVRAPWGFSIPPYALGSRFIDGSRLAIDGIYPPEQPMSVLLGVFGSAYAFTLKRAYEEIEKRIPAEMKNIIEKIDVAKAVGQKRVAAALFANFMVGLQAGVLKNKKNIKLADAGLGITGGLPFQPVSGVDGRRKTDVYIIVDMSEDVTNAQDLRRIEQFMHNNSMKFPAVPQQSNLENQMITIIQDIQDAHAPVVIYLPRTKDQLAWNIYKSQPEFEEYRSDLEEFSMQTCFAKEKGQDCTTFNLQYKEDVARKVARLAQFNMQASMHQIRHAINALIDRRSP